jgi:hypothetical protein
MNVSNRHDTTFAGHSRGTKIGLYAGFGIAASALGYALPYIAAWALRLPWFPFEGPMRLIHALDGPYLRWILALVGLSAGFAIAYIAVRESLQAAVSDHEVELEQDGRRKTIARRDVAHVFLDGKQLVVLGTSGYELARMPGVDTPEAIANAFRAHGYPWSDGDPYKDRYRRWVPDLPELSPSAHALLKAREKALQDKNEKDIAELRDELAKLGYIVRDEGKRQFWRPVEPPRETQR